MDADARFEARDRALLADAADEGAERRGRAARAFERGVRGLRANVGDVDRAGLFERLARVSSDRDGNVDQAFVAAACRHDDLIIVGIGGARFLREGGRGEGDHRKRAGGKDGTAQRTGERTHENSPMWRATPRPPFWFSWAGACRAAPHPKVKHDQRFNMEYDAFLFFLPTLGRES